MLDGYNLKQKPKRNTKYVAIATDSMDNSNVQETTNLDKITLEIGDRPVTTLFNIDTNEQSNTNTNTNPITDKNTDIINNKNSQVEIESESVDFHTEVGSSAQPDVTTNVDAFVCSKSDSNDPLDEIQNLLLNLHSHISELTSQFNKQSFQLNEQNLKLNAKMDSQSLQFSE